MISSVARAVRIWRVLALAGAAVTCGHAPGCSEDVTSRFEFACTSSVACGPGFTCDPAARRCRALAATPSDVVGDGAVADLETAPAEIGAEAGETGAEASDPDSGPDSDPGPAACPGGVRIGDYVIGGPEAASALTGCTAITGALTVTAPGMTTLALPTLETVGGSVDVRANSDLVSLSMGALRSVGGRVSIASNPALARIDGLEGLHDVGGLQVGTNPVLSRIDLAALTEVRGDLEIANNAVLTYIACAALGSVQGDLHVDTNAALPDLAGFFALTTVEGGLYVQSNAALANLDGLASLASAQRLHLYANPALTSILGLGRFAHLTGPFTVLQNRALPTCQAEALLRRLLDAGYLGTGGDAIEGNDDAGTCP